MRYGIALHSAVHAKGGATAASARLIRLCCAGIVIKAGNKHASLIPSARDIQRGITGEEVGRS